MFSPWAGWALAGCAGVTAAVSGGCFLFGAGRGFRVRFTVLNGALLVFFLVLLADRIPPAWDQAPGAVFSVY
jgi:hypothetical protein